MPTPIPLDHGLLLAAALFALGLVGLIARRNVLFMLMSVEIMMNAPHSPSSAAGARWQEPDGQVMFVLVLTLAGRRSVRRPRAGHSTLSPFPHARRRRGGDLEGMTHA